MSRRSFGLVIAACVAVVMPGMASGIDQRERASVVSAGPIHVRVRTLDRLNLIWVEGAEATIAQDAVRPVLVPTPGRSTVGVAAPAASESFRSMEEAAARARIRQAGGMWCVGPLLQGCGGLTMLAMFFAVAAGSTLNETTAAVCSGVCVLAIGIGTVLEFHALVQALDAWSDLERATRTRTPQRP